MKALIVLALVVVSGGVSAQELQRNRDAEEEIWRLTRQFYEARLRNDAGVVNRFLALDYYLVEAGGLQAEWGNRRRGPFNQGLDGNRWLDVDLDDERVRVYGNTAVSTYRREIRTRLATGRTQEQLEAASDTWVRQGGSWRMVLSHAAPMRRR